jgi:hypothetical protein
MPTTVDELIEAAYAKSTKNKAGTIATDAVELLGVANRALRKYFSRIARANPVLIGDIETVSFAAGGWARPADKQSILRLEINGTGEEVHVVPFDDRQAEEELPSVYRLGRTYYSAGNANDPTSGDIDFWCAAFPSQASATTQTIDSLWPEEFNECLIHEVAIYLATKDGRADELTGLMAERDEWEELLLEFCEHETANERRRFDLLNKFQTPRRRPNDAGAVR